MAANTNMVRHMHYDFKQKLNKIDAQQYRNLKVPEIDWKLNEATNIFIKRIAQPRTSPVVGFEYDTRSINDIRTIVINDHPLTTSKVNDKVFTVTLPENYLYHLTSRSVCVKAGFTAEIKNTIQKHTRDFRMDTFVQSSFEWREINGLIIGEAVKIYTDGTFEIPTVNFDYIRKPQYIHTAQDAAGGTYNLPNGVALTGYQNCELPEDVYGEIVDLAVLITTGDLISDYQTKFSKIQITDN